MKKLRASLIVAISFASLHASNLFAAEPPIATLTVKNHQELLSVVTSIANAANPGVGAATAAMLPAFLGTPQLAGVDPNRPWQAAAWSRANGGGSLAVYVPVTDFAAFKAGLIPGILAGSQNENTVADKNGYAVIFNPNKGGFTDEDRNKALNWKVAAAQTEATLNLHFAPDDAVKQMLLGGFRDGREQALQGMMQGLKAAPQNANLDPDSFKELMDIYFSLFETALAGFDQLNISLSVANGDIVIGEQVSATEGSDLARWFAPNPNGVAADVDAVDWNAPLAFAGSMRSDPTLSSFIEKAMLIGFKMQGLYPDSEQAKETVKLMKNMLPLIAAGSMSFDNGGMNFGGYYRFPTRKAEEFYSTMLDFVNTTMQKQVGNDKMYKTYDYQKAVRKIDDIVVDRLTMAYNLDSPLFQAPGQKEQIKAMFPDGKMELEYALADGKLFFTMGEVKMEKALESLKGNTTKARIKAGPKTSFVGQMNLLAMIKGMFQNMPFAPIPKQVIEAIDTKDTGIQTRADQDGSLDLEMRVPLKLIQSVSAAVAAGKAARAQQNAN